MTEATGKDWRLIHGDCLEVMAGLERVDHIITDPPYSAHVHGKSRAGARKLHNGTRGSTCREVSFGFEHLSASTRRGVALHAKRLTRRWTLAFCDVESSHLWRRSMVGVGLDYCRTCAWIKIGATPQFTGDRPGVGFEAIASAHQPGRKRWNGGGSLGVWSHLIAAHGSPSGTAERVHPTQKPVALMMELVSLFTDPGETVLDPFAGSGTTGVACLRLGRQFVGIEKDEKFFALACERLRAEDSGTTLHAARAGQGALFG